MSLYVDYDDDSDFEYGDFEDDYIWAEAGGWGLADELASGAIPDPPALYYRDDELEEYDNYNFWSEIEYGNGEIYDGEVSVEDAIQDSKPRDKKKKSKADHLKDTIRKIRLKGIQEFPAVMWIPRKEARSLRYPYPAYQKPQRTTALLPNWREHFKNHPYVATTSSPRDLTDRSKAKEEDDEEEGGDWEDMSVEGEENEDEDEGEEGEEDTDMQDIDPDLLKTALASKLSGSGLTAADQAAFMESLVQMVSSGGGGDMDNLLESLTSKLLNKVTEDGTDSSTAQWLSGQGVSLDEDEEEDIENSTPAILPTGTSVVPSPKDSVAADLPAAPQISTSSSKDLRQTATKTAGQKRKQQSLEAAKDTASPQSDIAVNGTELNGKRPRRAPAPAQPVATSAKNKTIATTSKATSRAKQTQSQPKATKAEENTDTATSPKESAVKSELAKTTTRKRKATTEEVSEEKPKRLRNFAAPTASSQNKTADTKTTEVKTTRSGRVRK